VITNFLSAIDTFLRIFTLSGFVFLILLKFLKKNKYTLKNPYFDLAIYAGCITFVFYNLDLYYWTTQESESIRILLHSLSYGGLILFNYGWYRHYNALSTYSYISNRLVNFTISGVWFLIIGYYVLNSLLNFTNITQTSIITPPGILITYISLATWLNGSIIFYYSFNICKEVNNFVKKDQTKADLAITGLLLFANVFSLIIDILHTFQIISPIISYVFLICSLLIFDVSLLLLMYNYIQNSTYLFYLPHTIDSILIYSSHGTLIYSEDFHDKYRLQEDRKHLISGLFNILSNLFKDTLATGGQLNSITLENYDIIFSKLPEDAGTIVCITRKSNYFIVKALEDFSKYIPSTLIQNLAENYSKPSNFTRELKENIQKFFPFIS